MTDTQMMIMELAAKNYSCGQILVLGGLRLMDRENPDLVRVASALAQGGGNSGNICGALMGGMALLSLHTAKGHDSEEGDEQELLLHSELLSRFQEHCSASGVITCDELLGNAGAEGERGMQPDRCAGYIAWVWEETIKLLVEYGFDPREGRPADLDE